MTEAKQPTHADDDAGILSVICVKCTREGNFSGETRSECVSLMRRSGWMLAQGRPVCPKCPGGGRPC